MQSEKSNTDCSTKKGTKNIITFNISGAKNIVKKRMIVSELNLHNYFLAGIQEISSTKNSENFDEKQWRNTLRAKHVFIAGSDNKTERGGVGICIARGVATDIEWVEKMPGGRAILMQCSLDGIKYLIINVHSPNKPAEQVTFFQTIYEKMKLVDDKRYNWLMMGDYNSSRVDNDRMGGLPGHRKKTNEMVDMILDEFDLEDIYRTRFHGPAYTWQRNKVARRLDYFFTPKRMNSSFKNVRIIPTVHSDHQILAMTVEKKDVFPRGPGFLRQMQHC